MPDGGTAYLPLMIVKSHSTIRENLFTNRIQGTTDGFLKKSLSLPADFLKGAETGAVLMAGEHTVAPFHNARHHVAIAVGVCHTLSVNHRLCRGRHVGPYGIETILYLSNLIEGHGRTGITLHAARSMARVEVAAKKLGQYVGGKQHIPDLNDGRKVQEN